ncbi:D-alanyl-D-alanine carboxypeptidase family protein [Legionella sp. W05-934-2]|uniref:D-alanyl-D-alanine carboxypeptidase family protein n=1 Tax=Legionella sp. W05-934-2 TaxID=1198649 RepID=UPI00346292BC
MLRLYFPYKYVAVTIFCFIVSYGQATTLPKQPPRPTEGPLTIPTAPTINAKSYILIDVDSGKVIAEKNSEQKLPPASLTKLMTLYVISNSLSSGQLRLEDNVPVSVKAWKTGGSRMFIKEGQQVSVENLLKGIIVDSGNDACVAMAEYIGGSEEGFTAIMNQQAQSIGMKNSHFTDSTGLPNAELYTTSMDLAILSRALIQSFPQYYHWYKQKWFTYNGIRQPNRNRLLWRDSHVDGMKTGHTNDAGYCLVSSAKKDNMRLIAVVLGSPSEAARADDSERLLNYGFRFFTTHQLFKAKETITSLPLYKGQLNQVNVGLKSDQYITIPTGTYDKLKVSTNIPSSLVAPIKQGQQIGELIIELEGKPVVQKPLYALHDVQKGGFFVRFKDGFKLTWNNWFGKA